MKQKYYYNISHAIVNANSIVQHIIQMKTGIIKHVNANLKLSNLQKYIYLGPSNI